MSMTQLLFSFQGRLNRKPYWLTNIAVGVVVILLVILAVVMFGEHEFAAFGLTMALLVVLVIGSGIAASSTTLVPIVVGRALQGMGIGVIALGISILRDVLPANRLPAAVAFISATLGFGGAISLLTGTLYSTQRTHVS